MDGKCNHPADSLIDVTEMAHARYHYLCVRCGETVIGYPVANVDPRAAYREELENMRKIKQWETLRQ